MSKVVPTGGLGEDRPVDDVVKDICEKVRSEVEEKSGVNYAEFTPIVHKTQLVNGVNYFIKVRVSEDKYIHIRAHRTFNGEISFAGFEDDKSLEQEIVYFR